MKALMTLIFAGLAGPTMAHPTHIIDVAGHNHWLAAAAIAAAALWQAKKSKDTEAEEAEEETDAEPQEA